MGDKSSSARTARAPGYRERLREQIEQMNAADRASATLHWLEAAGVFDDDDAR